jgi:histone H2A
MSARGGKKRQKAMSKSQRANVTFPVGRMHRYLKMGTHRLRIGVGSPVYMAAVIEYLTGMKHLLKISYKRGCESMLKQCNFFV